MTEHIKDGLMSDEEFQLLKDLVNRKFGILVKGDKRLTFHTRISHRLSILGLTSYRDYYNFVIADSTDEELYTIASQITNNETYFFREKNQLDAFSEILKNIKKVRQEKNQNKLRILSLACSTGEEPYTLNIIIQENGLFVWNWDIEITGIDIDKNAIKKAQDACYTKNSFRSMNGNMNFVKRYFSVRGDRYSLRNPYKNNVNFRQGNILDNNTFADLNNTDVIFCRNVLIYMSEDAIKKIVLNMYNSLSDEGFLFLGSAESLIQKTDLFFPEYTNGIIVYRKNVKN